MTHKMTIKLPRRAGMLKLPRRAAMFLPGATLAAATMAASGLTACTVPKAKVAGTQIPVLPVLEGLDVSIDAPPVTLPAAAPAPAWPQFLAGPTHAPGNIAGPTGFHQAWRAKIGTPGGYRQPLIASPLVANGAVFTMDADGAVSAFSLSSGARQWRVSTRPKHLTVTNIGGGIGYDSSGGPSGTGSGILYASTGYSELLAIDPDSGKIIWRQPLDFPARSAPTIGGGIVAVNIQNDLLLTFDPATGTPGWRFSGQIISSPTSVALAGAPAIDSGIIVAGFSSGTLAALDVNSGTPLWEQSLASAYGQASVLDFSDVSGAPVIANGVVYAASLGQTMMAVDLRSGAKVWVRSASGAESFCAAGDFLFVLDTADTLAAIHADDGLVTWALQLPVFRNTKKKKGAQSWNGPILVNGELLLTSTLGDLISVDAMAGAISSTQKLHAPADLPPIAAGGSLLQLTRDATLTAFS